MQQWWFDDGLGLKSVICVFFYDFPLILRFSLIFMNIKNKYLHRWPWDYRHMSNLPIGARISSL